MMGAPGEKHGYTALELSEAERACRVLRSIGGALRTPSELLEQLDRGFSEDAASVRTRESVVILLCILPLPTLAARISQARAARVADLAGAST